MDTEWTQSLAGYLSVFTIKLTDTYCKQHNVEYARFQATNG